jgi:MtfA peptidase
MFGILDYFRRRRAQREPFPEAWRAMLRERIPFYGRLTGELRPRFEEKLKIFARTKYFIGAGGMEITEEVKVVISAAAARLIMNLPGELYSLLSQYYRLDPLSLLQRSAPERQVS